MYHYFEGVHFTKDITLYIILCFCTLFPTGKYIFSIQVDVFPYYQEYIVGG